MSPERDPSIADVGDRHRRLMALGLLAVGVMYGVQAVEYLVGPSAARGLGLLTVALAVTVLGLIAPIFVWKVRSLPRGEWHLYRGEGGYVAEALSRAHIASWATTFLFLLALDLFLDHLPELPTGFFIKVGVFVMATSFAVVFLVLEREPGSEEEHHADA